jgi:hypothetical protein
MEEHPAPLNSIPLYRLCNKPVSLETAKTDGDGQAVHEDCYVLKSTLKNVLDEIV